MFSPHIVFKLLEKFFKPEFSVKPIFWDLSESSTIKKRNLSTRFSHIVNQIEVLKCLAINS